MRPTHVTGEACTLTIIFVQNKIDCSPMHLHFIWFHLNVVFRFRLRAIYYVLVFSFIAPVKEFICTSELAIRFFLVIPFFNLKV
jgi:hypothetical protein